MSENITGNEIIPVVDCRQAYKVPKHLDCVVGPANVSYLDTTASGASLSNSTSLPSTITYQVVPSAGVGVNLEAWYYHDIVINLQVPLYYQSGAGDVTQALPVTVGNAAAVTAGIYAFFSTNPIGVSDNCMDQLVTNEQFTSGGVQTNLNNNIYALELSKIGSDSNYKRTYKSGYCGMSDYTTYYSGVANSTYSLANPIQALNNIIQSDSIPLTRTAGIRLSSVTLITNGAGTTYTGANCQFTLSLRTPVKCPPFMPEFNQRPSLRYLNNFTITLTINGALGNNFVTLPMPQSVVNLGGDAAAQIQIWDMPGITLATGPPLVKAFIGCPSTRSAGRFVWDLTSNGSYVAIRASKVRIQTITANVNALKNLSTVDLCTDAYEIQQYQTIANFPVYNNKFNYYSVLSAGTNVINYAFSNINDKVVPNKIILFARPVLSNLLNTMLHPRNLFPIAENAFQNFQFNSIPVLQNLSRWDAYCMSVRNGLSPEISYPMFIGEALTQDYQNRALPATEAYANPTNDIPVLSGSIIIIDPSKDLGISAQNLANGTIASWSLSGSVGFYPNYVCATATNTFVSAPDNLSQSEFYIITIKEKIICSTGNLEQITGTLSLEQTLRAIESNDYISSARHDKIGMTYHGGGFFSKAFSAIKNALGKGAKFLYDHKDLINKGIDLANSKLGAGYDNLSQTSFQPEQHNIKSYNKATFAKKFGL